MGGEGGVRAQEEGGGGPLMQLRGCPSKKKNKTFAYSVSADVIGHTKMSRRTTSATRFRRQILLRYLWTVLYCVW